MANITFTGDPRFPNTDPDQIEMHGIVFPLGAPVTVDDEAIVAKLAGHTHFSVDSAAPKTDRMAAARAAKAARRPM